MRRKVEYGRVGAKIIANIYGPDYGAVLDPVAGYDRWRLEESYTGSDIGQVYDAVEQYLPRSERDDALKSIGIYLDGPRHTVRRGW